jgi:hypothetical protein
MRNLKRKAVGAVVAVLMSVGIGTTVVTPASATDQVKADIWGACNDQGHWGAWFYDWNNSYSFFCIDHTVGLPWSISYTNAGSVDVNSWCIKHVGEGYVARATSNTVRDWYCVK